MIRQVRAKVVNFDANGVASSPKTVFVFGTHPLAATTDYPALGPNSPVVLAVTQQSFRLIIDELLVGNNLEELECRGPIDAAGDSYDRVPLGTTPDDIAKCSAAKDVLTTQCPGSMAHAVCICRDDGCGTVKKGDPVGVQDVNQDGAADDTRLIQGSVGIKCGMFDVPINIDASYWNPSGDQNKPAMGGLDALGPAIVLKPGKAGDASTASLPLPTNQDCQLVFASDVTDKQGNQVCAPPEGDVNQNCTPGDMSNFKFRSDALRVTNANFANNAMGVDRSAPVNLVANAPVDNATAAVSVTMTQGATPFTGFTIDNPASQPALIKITYNAPLTAMTTYTITVATTLADTYGVHLPQMVSYTFTTGG
jgi:hypothetical protein